MAQMSFDTLRVESVEERTHRETGEMFPVAIVSGISLNVGAKGSSFTKRRVSLPLNGMSLQDAKDSFPIGFVLPKRFAIQQFTVAEYKWEGPNGETLKSNKRYRLVDTTAPPPVDDPVPQSTVEEPSTQKSAQATVPTEVGA